MPQGGVINTVATGGGAPGGNAAQQVKTVIVFDVSPAGTVNTRYTFGSTAAIKSTLDPAGRLAGIVQKILDHYKGGVVHAVPVAQSTAGAIPAAGATTQVGNGAGTVTVSCAPHKQITIKCTTSGALGTAKFQFSLDGGTTYGPIVTSVASGPPWTYAVPGTFCVLSFGAASYVATKTNVIGADGSVTPGALWVGTVTQASSPLDNYDFVCTVSKGGALGTCSLSVSPDGNKSVAGNFAVPAGGVVVVPNTGIVLTCASTFAAGDTYSFVAIPPGVSTTDLNTALAAVYNDTTAPTVALVYCSALPASAAGAISMGSTIDTAIGTAAGLGKQWIGMCDCPVAPTTTEFTGDAVVSGGNAIADTADTAGVLRTARAGVTYNHTSVCVGTHRMPSSLTSWQLRYPTGTALAARYVEDNPNNDVSAVARGGLDITVIGRDESAAATSLYDVQYNTVTTYPGKVGTFLTIESGGFGWRNMTTDPTYQDANFVRVLAAFLDAITQAGYAYLGSRQPTNADGTITATAAAVITADLDGVAKKSMGLKKGGAFTVPQASSASAQCLGSSQLGSAPHRLDVQYNLQDLGFVSAVANNVFASGTLSISPPSG